MKSPYVNIAVPTSLRDRIKALAKDVPRRTIITYLESIISEEEKKSDKKK